MIIYFAQTVVYCWTASPQLFLYIWFNSRTCALFTYFIYFILLLYMYVHVCAVVLYAFMCLISAFAVIDSIDVHLTRVIKFTYLINISMLLDCRGGVQPRVTVRKIVTGKENDNNYTPMQIMTQPFTMSITSSLILILIHTWSIYNMTLINGHRWKTLSQCNCLSSIDDCHFAVSE